MELTELDVSRSTSRPENRARWREPSFLAAISPSLQADFYDRAELALVPACADARARRWHCHLQYIACVSLFGSVAGSRPEGSGPGLRSPVVSTRALAGRQSLAMLTPWLPKAAWEAIGSRKWGRHDRSSAARCDRHLSTAGLASLFWATNEPGVRVHNREQCGHRGRADAGCASDQGDGTGVMNWPFRYPTRETSARLRRRVIPLGRPRSLGMMKDRFLHRRLNRGYANRASTARW